MKADMKPKMLFEVSWEVCNKVGGIHEVVASKALQAVEVFGENYFLLGPDLKNNPEFEETDEGTWDSIRHALSVKDLRCRFGRWNIPGKPKVILVDFAKRYNSNQLLHEIWERYAVDSLSGGWDYIEPVMFSYACGEVITAIHQAIVVPRRGQSVGQFHEWMCGAGILAVKRFAPDVGTVFTTHATMLGRAMAGSGVDIYQQMRAISPSQEAAAHNITAKCSLETASAREADVFTTVSQITADEATAFLGRVPDIITTNGLDMRVIQDYSSERQSAVECRARLLKPINKLLRRELPENTRIMAISGRYEFHNKGLDVFLDALAGAQNAMQNSETHILALFLVMGGHTGANPAAVNGDLNVHPDPENPAAGFLTSHHVYNQPDDPILNTCRRLGLQNREDNHVQIVFVPAMLDGNDGFLNMQYFEILAGCDLGVFPSWYEPWGYTPHESAAYGVPTVTTDLSGFGLWARDLEIEQGRKNGVVVLPRRMRSYDETVASLRTVLLEYATASEEALNQHRTAARKLVEGTSWIDFFNNYIQAYTLAMDKAKLRADMLSGTHKRESLSRVLTAKSSTTPFLRTLTAVAELPPALSRLRELAYNLWWCWCPEAKELFSEPNPKAWDEYEHNPVRMIEEADPAVLTSLSLNKQYLAKYERVMTAFDTYMNTPLRNMGATISSARPIAYFSTEYGLHESLPIYSGGLGVLSGDHLKSASDLGVPLIGIGLLYKNGYFRQKLDKTGRQVAIFPENDFSTLPFERVLNAEKRPMVISLDMPGRTLYAQIWVCQVGRIPLYLMDTDIPSNTDDDRRITARLYESDRDLRLRQELLLGMGGVRLAYKLGLDPALFHMNEGHSAFLVLERLRMCMHNDDMNFMEACELVRGGSVFTTHTPVDAGNERFSVELVERYFTAYAQSIGISWQDFLRLGRLDGGDQRNFDMTVLALRLSHSANAVSWLHGYVSRRMWRNIWKGAAVSEVPVSYVTNGVHTPSYVGPRFKALLDQYVGENWPQLPTAAPEWNKVLQIPDSTFWEARRVQKENMLCSFAPTLNEAFIKYNLDSALRKQACAHLSANALVIGFARRFAPYKRATLLFADPDRLARLLNQPGKPVVLLFSGKAHPADQQGADLIQEVVRYSQDPRFLGNIFFIEDYSLAISRQLVQGCDVWLNTPRRPYEASGTSGEKVPANGGINLSISDGWWVEGYNLSNGWTIGPVIQNGNLVDDQNDYADAESLYTLLEDQVIPTFFERNEDGIPHRWLNMAKESMRSLTAEYSSGRMVAEYLDSIYLPTAHRYLELNASRQKMARTIAAWRQQVATRFNGVHLEEIRIQGVEGDTLMCGQPLTVYMRLTKDALEQQELLAQLVIGPTDGTDFIDAPAVIRLTVQPSDDPTSLLYTGTYIATRNGRYAYGIRVMPTTEGLDSPISSNLVLWG